MNPPSTTELMRRLDDLVVRIDRIVDSLEHSFLRKEVYAADRQADAFQSKAIEDDLHLLNKRVDNLATQRDSERDAIIDRLRSNNRAVVAAVFASLVGPVLVVLILRSMGLVHG